MLVRILTEEQLEWLCENTPEWKANPKGGRPAADKRRTIEGIFWILDNGAKWKDLPAQYGSRATVHRWFAKWARAGVFESLMQKAGQCIEQQGGFKLYECFVDGTFSKAKSGGDQIGLTRVGKGSKIMIMVDAHGLPVAAMSGSASPYEGHLVQRLFDFMISSKRPERLVGDKAYDDDILAQELAEEGVELIAPNRSNRQIKTQDGRPLRRYKRRWKVERTIAWLQHFRRLCIRWEKSNQLFQGLLHLGCCLLIISEVLR